MINYQKGHVNGESNFSQLFCMKKKKKDKKAIKLSNCCGIIVIMLITEKHLFCAIKQRITRILDRGEAEKIVLN